MASLNGIRWLLLDWGNTLMRVLPEAKASMAEWPIVELMPGVKEALPDLRKAGFRLALISNAENSDVPQVRKALKRAGIDEFIERIYLARVLGSRKPETAFFNAVLRDLECAPSQALVVGDTLKEDIIGAQRAGITAVWFRPRRARIEDFPLCPCIYSFNELPGYLSSLMSGGRAR
jgi:HAD superfamily hydrolase (TIGR01662 family)